MGEHELCSVCRTLNQSGDNTCIRCKSPLPNPGTEKKDIHSNMIKCPNCDSMNGHENKNCYWCEQPISLPELQRKVRIEEERYKLVMEELGKWAGYWLELDEWVRTMSESCDGVYDPVLKKMEEMKKEGKVP